MGASRVVQGAHSGRRALLVDYTHGARQFEQMYLPATSMQMTLVFFPGNASLRALTLDDRAPSSTHASLPFVSLDDALDKTSRQLAANPWQWPQPMLFGDGVPRRDPPDGGIAQTHAKLTALRFKDPLPVPGKFADFRDVGGYDSSKDTIATGLGILSNLAGVAAIQSKKIETEVDLDLPEMAHLALSGMATVNQAIVDRMKQP